MNFNARARTFVVGAALAALLWPSDSPAQTALQPTSAPRDTAEDAPWYVGGEPITFAGNVYYPAGPRVFFNRYEMIRSGFYEGVPLYTRTTIEPFSVVFVPVGGGVMHPYERRRAGDIAGTAGSTTPAFPMVTAAEQGWDRSQGVLPQAAAPPTRIAMSIGDTTRELTDVTPGTSQGFAPPMAPPAVPTTGDEAVPVRVAPLTPRGPMQTVLRPTGLNGVFIDFDSRRWFSSGPAVEFSSSRFTKIGEHRGFPVYSAATGGNANTIYVALTIRGGDLVAPYSLRR